jgi:hypothetical protein
MKTVVAFTMAALATLVLATAADADVQDRQCQRGRGIGVRAETPCVIRPLSYWVPWARPVEIIERPHNGTAVLRADGSIYYSPKPGFTGRDSIRVRRTDCSTCFFGANYTIFVE